MPFRLTTESGRRAATAYARSGRCPPAEAERIERLVKEARAAARRGDRSLCYALASCLEEGTPSPAEIAEKAGELRQTWIDSPSSDSAGTQTIEPWLPDRCEHCGKKFRNPAALILHIRENHQLTTSGA